jgi:sugar phosphate isomerase/epimerase
MFKNLNPGALGVTGHQSEIIELALSFGFTSVDLNVVEFAMQARLKGVPYARRLFDSAALKMGLKLGTFAFPFDWESDDETFAKEMKKLPEYAQAAVAAGCTRCVATLAPASDARPYHENFEFHKRRFQEICQVFDPAGIRFGIGFQAAEYLRKNRAFQFVHELDALTLLVNMVSSPCIGLLLDIWDVIVSGGSLDAIRKLPPEQIVAVQVADLVAASNNGEIDEKSRLLPGVEGGRIDVPTFLVYLKSAGYDGPITPRPSRGIFQSRRRDMMVKQTGEALDKVWRAAGLPNERRFVPSAATLDYNIDFGM